MSAAVTVVMRPIAATITSCEHRVRGLTKPPAVSVLHLSFRTLSCLYTHVSTHHVDAAYFYVSLIYLKYRYLANVHFCDIPHTFIPHFTLYSAEKNPHCIFCKLPVRKFPHSAKHPFPPRDEFTVR